MDLNFILTSRKSKDRSGGFRPWGRKDVFSWWVFLLGFRVYAALRTLVTCSNYCNEMAGSCYLLFSLFCSTPVWVGKG